MRRRRRMQHPGRESRHRHLGTDLLFNVLSRYDRKGGLRLARLWREWENVVGPDIAQLAQPLGHREGALLLAAQDAVAAQQLSYYSFELLERVNAFFGEEVFDKLRFELLNGRVPLGLQEAQEPAPAPRPQEKPRDLGALVDVVDPETAAGRCYLAYVRHFSGQAAQAQPTAANTRPSGASRRRK